MNTPKPNRVTASDATAVLEFAERELQRRQDASVMTMMEKYGGSFVKSLAAACRRADTENLARIKGAFPEIWESYGQFARLEKGKNGTP